MDHPPESPPFPYEIDVARRVLYVVASGPVDLGGVRAGVRALVADPRFAPDLRGYVNARFWMGELPSLDMLKALVVALRPILLQPIRRRCAVLVRTEEVLHRVRAFEGMSSGSYVQFRAFEDDRAAHSWLGIESGLEPWSHHISHPQ